MLKIKTNRTDRKPALAKINRLFLFIPAVLVVGALWAFSFWPKERSASIAASKTPLQPRSCSYEPISGHDLNCYWFHTLDGFKLPVAVFKSKSKKSNKEALLFLPGGPGDRGNTGYEGLRNWDFWLSEGLIKQDLVVFEYRGIAPGSPKIQCVEYQAESKALLKRAVSVEEEDAILLPSLLSCLERLSVAYPGVIESINSQTNAQDALALVAALGYKRITPIAVSYGTRVALQMINKPVVHAVVLDSLYSQKQDSLVNLANDWRLAFKAFWTECASLPSCNADQLRAGFFKIFEELQSSSMRVRSRNWQTSYLESWQLTHQRFLFAAFNALYLDFKRAELINFIQFTKTAALPEEHPFLEYFYNNIVSSEFNAFIYLLTQCNDVGVPSNLEITDVSEEEEFWFNLIRGSYGGSNLCEQAYFKKTELSELESAKPVMLVSGQRDPVTPLKYSELYNKRLENGRLLVLPNAGHGEFIQSACSAKVLADFLDHNWASQERIGKLELASCQLAWQ